MQNDQLLQALNQIKSLADSCISALSTGSAPKTPPSKGQETQNAETNIIAIINKIKNCDESEKIESAILDKLAESGRILLPFYICYKYFPQQRLSTGDIQKITSELGVKVKTSNASTAIAKGLQKYLDGDSTRTRGKAVGYKLNRKGAKYFESLLGMNQQQEP